MEHSCEHENSVDIVQDVAGKGAKENVESELRRLRYYLYKKSKTKAVTEDLEMYKTKICQFNMNFHDDLSK